jgi:hypothetical protein
MSLHAKVEPDNWVVELVALRRVAPRTSGATDVRRRVIGHSFRPL